MIFAEHLLVFGYICMNISNQCLFEKNRSCHNMFEAKLGGISLTMSQQTQEICCQFAQHVWNMYIKLVARQWCTPTTSHQQTTWHIESRDPLLLLHCPLWNSNIFTFCTLKINSQPRTVIYPLVGRWLMVRRPMVGGWANSYPLALELWLMEEILHHLGCIKPCKQ